MQNVITVEISTVPFISLPFCTSASLSGSEAIVPGNMNNGFFWLKFWIDAKIILLFLALL